MEREIWIKTDAVYTRDLNGVEEIILGIYPEAGPRGTAFARAMAIRYGGSVEDWEEAIEFGAFAQTPCRVPPAPPGLDSWFPSEAENRR